MPFHSTPLKPKALQTRLHMALALFAVSVCAVNMRLNVNAQAQTIFNPRISPPATAHRRAKAFVQGRTAEDSPNDSQGAPALAAARAQHLLMRASPKAASLATPWTPVGPVQVQTSTYGLVTGRVTAVAVDPSDVTGNTVYVGTSGGGVWKSTNASGNASAVSFSPLTDTLQAFSPSAGTSAIPSLSIGAVNVQPGGTGVILAGTGDPNDAADSYYGSGLLRSADNGLTWSLIPYAVDTGGIHSFVGQGFAGFAWSTTSPQLVVAAVSSSAESAIVRNDVSPAVRGLYFSTDSGTTWNLSTIQDGSTIVQNQNTNFTSFRGNAATAVSWNPIRRRFYAAVRFHGYYESLDGMTWTRLVNQPGTGLTSANCPTRAGNYGSSSCPIFRGAIAAQPTSGDIFALTVDANNVDQGLWQDSCRLAGSACTSSTVNWATKLNNTTMDEAGAIDEGDYNLTLAALPAATALSANDTLLFAGAADLYRCSLAGGCTLRNTTNTSNGCAAPAGVAPAQHAIAWQTNLSNSATPLVYIGNDGGLWRSTDGVGETGGACSTTDASHFDNLNGALGSLGEISSLSSHPTDPTILLAALGANGSAESATSAQASNQAPWVQLNAAESGTVAIDQGNATTGIAQVGAGVAFHTCSNGNACTTADFAGVASVGPPQTGNDISLVDPPALLDPVLNTNLIVGTCRVWRGPSGGASAWSSSNAISPFLAGPAATACNSSDATIRSLAAGGAVQLTNASQTSGSPVLYAGLSGVADGGSTFGGHIFGTTRGNIANSTTPWTDLTSSIVTNDPSGFNPGGFDISSIAVDPNDTTGYTVYATILGFGYPHLYRSTNAGATWTNISANLPNAPANAVAVDPNDARTVYVAMDTGVYATTNVASCSTINCWSVLGASLPNAPVLSLVASRGLTAPGGSATGLLRAGTYGRGIWQQPLLSAGTASLPVVTFTPSSLTFTPAQNVGTTSVSQTATLTNTGNASMVITSVLASAGFIETDTCSGTTLPVGSTCSIAVSFSPVVDGPATGTIQVVANVIGGYAVLPLNGTGIGVSNIALSPASLTFPSTPVGTTSVAQTVTVTNNGTATATLAPAMTTQDYGVPSTTCASSLIVGASCSISVNYAPTTVGANAGLLTVSDSATSRTVVLNASATGAPVISVTPSSLTYGTTPIGGFGFQVVTVANTGTAAAQLGTPTVSSGNFFIASDSGCMSLLPANSSCSIIVGFDPTAVTIPTATLTVVVAGTTYTVLLNGYGVLFPNVTLAPNTLTFPATDINTVSARQTLTFTNLDHTPLDLTAGLTQVSGDFGVPVNTCTGIILQPSASCTFSIVFNPTAAGSRIGQLVYTFFQGDSLGAILSGTGTGNAIVGVSPSALTFAPTNLGTLSIPQTITITNTGNVASSLSAPALTGDFIVTSNTCPSTIGAGASCTVSILFAPVSTGARTGSATFTDASGTQTVALNGSGVGVANVTLAPTTIVFASTPVNGTSAAQIITVSNTGSAASALSTPAIIGDFALVTNTCGTSIAAGSSCTLSVTFNPRTVGPRVGSLSISAASSTHSVSLSGGSVTGVLSTSATTLTFADTALNATSPSQSLTVSNTGTGTLTISSVAISGDFSDNAGCAVTALAPGNSCTIILAFTPTVVGARTGTLTLTSNSNGTAGTVTTVALAGNGKGTVFFVLTPMTVNFGTQITGTTSAVTNITISNTGTASGALQSVSVSGDFLLKANTCGTSLATQTGCTVSIAFAPTVSGARSGVLTVIDEAGTQTAALTGTGTAAATDTLTPLSLTFGTQQVNTTSTAQAVTLTNSGDTPLTLVASQILSGDFIAVNNCGPTLAAHSTCAITVTFVPKSVGAATGTLQVSDVLHVQTVALNGTSIAGPGVSLLPNSTTFAATGVGVASVGQTLTLTNNGGIALQLGAITLTGDFGIVSSSNSCSLTTPIAPSGSCTFQVAFVPTAAGVRSGTITVLSNAATQTAQLLGTGIDFALVANGPTSLTVATGTSAVFPLLLRPATSTTNPVTYTCTGAPTNAKCTLTSQYTDLSAISTVTVTVLTGTTASQRIGTLALVLPIFGLPFCMGRRRAARLLLAIMLTTMLFGAVSCGAGRAVAIAGTGTGGGGGTAAPITPAGGYTITVSATAAGVTHTVPLTLIVQ